MNITIQAIHFQADDHLRNFIHEKAEKLVDFFEGIIDAEVVIWQENTSQPEKYGVEFKVKVPKQLLVAKDHAQNFYSATEQAQEQMIRQLKKYKEKHYSHA
jgi:putative sigma-54 modulation protein